MLVTVDRHLNPLNAFIIRGRLEAEDLDAYVIHAYHAWANWLVALAIGHIKVQVPQHQADQALLVLDDIKSGVFETLLLKNMPENRSPCPRCGANKIRSLNWPWRIALFLSLLITYVFPFTVFRVRCENCAHTWTQKELRGYSLGQLTMVILLFALVFVLFNIIYYAVCARFLLDEMCY